jgi:hypothetical protein
MIQSRFLPHLVLRIAAMIGALCFFVSAALPVAAIERGEFSLEVLVDGIPLTEYATRGKTYVEAIEGREYSLRVTNHTARRIAVALSVDGLNTIDAKTSTAGAASKWILAPYQTLTLDGWQTSSSTARRFFFTTEDESYGAWLGETSNLGIISAVVFRERRPRPAPITRPYSKESGRSQGKEGASAGERRERSKDAARPEQPSPPGASPRAESELSDELAATGIGRELDHRVRRVRFESESTPAAVMELRYEYHDALVRLGVLPHPYAQRERRLERRERAQGFEGLEFAPDPFR